MSVFQSLSVVALRQVVEGACEAVGLTTVSDPVVSFLSSHFTDHSQRLTTALKTANENAWKALEIALTGNSFWERCKVAIARAEDKAFAQQVRVFLDTTPLPELAGKSQFRQKCLEELRLARKVGALTVSNLNCQLLTRQTADFARFSDPESLVDAEWRSMIPLAEELKQGGYPNLGWLLAQRPQEGTPILGAAVRYFFRRAVEDDPKLFQGLTFAKQKSLGEVQDRGFTALATALSQQGRWLEELLGDVKTVVVETHAAVLDLRGQIQGQSEQIQQIGEAVMRMLEQHQLQRRELRPSDSLSIRNEGERQMVKQLVSRYRALPEEHRRHAPALLNGLGKLQVVAGDFDAAQRDFQQVATLVSDGMAQAEAHFNAYRTALERRDWDAALRELLKAVKLDGKGYAPFPVGKFHPLRILGAGGFGVAFLCKHKQLNADIVVKTVTADQLDRELDEVFREAQLLFPLDHPSIIRLLDCGYTLPASKSRPYFVMHYFAGQTLEELVLRTTPLTASELLEVADQMAAGLEAAHARGILHRDIKPANVLVQRQGSNWQVKLIDFGLALDQRSLEGAGAGNSLRGVGLAGTRNYAAPEQMGQGPGIPIGLYSDVYGFARTCCFALFRTPNPRPQHWDSIPKGLARLLDRCLEDDGLRRPADLRVVRHELAALRQTPPLPSIVRASHAPPAIPPANAAPSAALTPFADVGLATNFEPRLPCVLLLDVSASMKGDRIQELQRGLQIYRTEILADNLAAQRVEVAVITFGAQVTVEQPFTTVDQFQPPTLTASGKTPLGGGLNRALDLLEQRRRQYRDHGLICFRPWLFLITDGSPTDDWRTAAERLKQTEAGRALSFFAVGVEGADMDILRNLSHRAPLRLKGLRFRDLFAWMSQSQRSVSQSAPGQEEQARLVDPTGDSGWASV